MTGLLALEIAGAGSFDPPAGLIRFFRTSASHTWRIVCSPHLYPRSGLGASHQQSPIKLARMADSRISASENEVAGSGLNWMESGAFLAGSLKELTK